MTLSEPVFLIFFAVVAAGWFGLPKKLRRPFLLLASCLFYAWTVPACLAVFAGTVGFAFFWGLAIGRAGDELTKKRVAAAGSVLLLALLFLFKYFGFLADSVAGLLGLLGLAVTPPSLSLIQPLGISFYTLQLVGYFCDLARGRLEPERDFLSFALFAGFFPQMVAGPVGRAGELLPQFKREHSFERARVTKGLQRMLEGAFCKIVVADGLAILVNGIWGDPSSFGGLAHMAAMAGFGLQLYCDFAGYSSMAVGAAGVLGIELRENFAAPYLATNFSGFWKRWHMSLTSFFTDYIFTPLVWSRWANRLFWGRRAEQHPPHILLNLMIVFTVSGLWHGASWNFVIWGAMVGALRVAEELLHLWRKRPVPIKNPLLDRLRRAGKSLVVFLSFSFTLIWFRAPDLASAAGFVGGMFRELSPAAARDDLLRLCAALPDGGFIFAKLFLLLLALSAAALLWYEAAAFRAAGRKGPYDHNYLFKRRRWLKYYLLASLTVFFLLITNAAQSAGAFIYGGF